MNLNLLTRIIILLTAVRLTSATTFAGAYNLKIVTDASPDYSDMDGMIRSITANWKTPEQKLWAMFYWNHIARRQTAPMELHGLALTDPIRQFNDYGYTMCSTISGINCSIWDAMGFKAKYWDISNHTVPEVEYAGAWHMYDNSMTALYTLCDGKTLAGVADIGKTLACEASHGQSEPGHIAKYHCLMATSPHGFLTGADTMRSLDEEYRCFNPNGLKYRSYFYDWDRGHRYILNVRQGESYTRYYHSLGDSPEFYVPNHGKDPEAVNKRYHLRGNGILSYHPNLADLAKSAYAISNLVGNANHGLTPSHPNQAGEVIFKIEGANVITALKIRGELLNQSGAASIAVSTVNGLTWKEVWNSDRTGPQDFDLELVEEVNGSYEVLVKVRLIAGSRPESSTLRDIQFETITMLNSKTQPKLNLGKNTIYVGAGDQSESIVLWPDLRGNTYEPYVVEEQNVVTAKQHPGYMGVLSASKPTTPAFVVFKIDAPREITSINYGGRLYNRAPGSHIEFLHSFDNGRTWTQSYSLTNTAQPWDVIHYETISKIPAGTRTVLFKYQLEGPAAGRDACSLYAVRMEANHRPIDDPFQPLAVTFNWNERQPDYSLVERSHTEIISKLPHRYTINVGGADHPIINSLRVASAGALTNTSLGYSDGKEIKADKFVSRWVTYGKNLALGKPYTVSIPSNNQWGAGDPNGMKLTDGIVGPPYPGGAAPASALCWNKGQQPEINVDLGETQTCAAFRIQLAAGYPWWDSLKGQIQDKVELLTSTDGQNFTSQGFFNFNLRWKDLPADYFWPDEEVIAAHNFELIPQAPVQARHIRYKLQAQRSVTVSEVEVLDSIHSEPFDLRIALPDQQTPASSQK